MAGSQDMMIIVVMMMMMSSVFSVLAGGAFFLTRPEEGDECKGKDDNGNYVIDEDRDCVLDYCDPGYYKSGKKCLEDQSGDVCEPTGIKDPNGTYLTDQSGDCIMSGCETGYTKSGTECVADDPCAGLTDNSLAYDVTVACIRKLLTDEGCTDQGTVWPDDDYTGWWRSSPQGTTTVHCDDQGTPCGAGNFATVKSDIHAWATLEDDLHVAGCGKTET
jgi:hypothetical protein